MNCQEVKENMLAYLEGSLGGDLPGRMKEHIETCDSCRAFQMFMLQVNLQVEDEKARRPNPFLYTRIQEKIDRKHEVPVHGYYTRLLRSPLYYAAVIIFAVSLGVFAGKQLGGLLSTPASTAPALSEQEKLKQEFYLQNLENDDISQLINNIDQKP